MKVISAGIQHESNTFCNDTTPIDDWIRDSECGDDLSGFDVVFDRFRDTNTIHGGYISGAEEVGVELVPVINCRAQPSGPISDEAFEAIMEKTLKRISENLPADGILMDLHGAMVTESYEDAEAEILRRVREVTGDIPLIMTLDLHANISQFSADRADVIIGYDTYPHVDMAERGHEAALLIKRMIGGDVKPTQSFRQLPMLTMPPMQCTLREPMQTVIRELHELESRPGVLTATISMGFPFADIRDAGVSVLVTTDNDLGLADSLCDAIASRLWNLREDLQPKLTSIEDVISYSNEHPDEVVVFADGSDNPGGGAPCDGTVALHALIKAEHCGAAVGLICDPAVADFAYGKPIGSEIDIELGAKSDDRHGSPVSCRAVIKNKHDGWFTYKGSMARGLRTTMGKTVLLDIDGIDVVVASERRQLLDSEMFRVAGVEPTEKRLLVLKSAVHFRADFQTFADAIFDADTPGIHRPDFSAFTYKRLRDGVYPVT